MKTLRILIFIFITAISSCASDGEIHQADELLGSWELSSSNDSHYYRLYFYEDNIGGESSGGYSSSDDTAISVMEGFTWSTIDNPKTLIIPNMKLNSPYSINAEGQLIINNLQKGLPFNKLD